jgi:hypothetical protein
VLAQLCINMSKQPTTLVRIPISLLEEAERAAEELSARTGLNLTRSQVLRAAVSTGLVAMTANEKRDSK